MAERSRKQAVSLSLRICFVALAAVCFLVVVSYRLLSKNFNIHFTDYAIDMVQSLVDQGVTTVEYELKMGRGEVSILADAITPPEAGERVVFPNQGTETETALRMLYVSETDTTASDGRMRDVRGREDVIKAFDGEPAVYGPYFNEEGEYVVCYSAPVRDDGKIVGVLSMEKDGYRFCELIKDIKFAETGEAYIINAQGTDIAVSDLNHIDWVNEGYNAEALLKIQENAETRSVYQLEQRGLNGETGVGNYTWEGKKCYVIYAPIPSENWVMLAGMREEEIVTTIHTTIITTIFKSSVPYIACLVFFLVMGLTVFWMLSNTKKNIEMSRTLEIMANEDELTGLFNRRILETSLLNRWKSAQRSHGQAAVFMMDIDNFKKYNDLFGHVKGDDCLRRVAEVFKEVFKDCVGDVIRYGGEEFVAVIFSVDKETAEELARKVCQMTMAEEIFDGEGGCVTVSVGICHVENASKISLTTGIEWADRAMYQAKKNGKNRSESICV